MKKTVSTFTPETARAIIDFVSENLIPNPLDQKGFQRGKTILKVYGKISGVASSGGIAKHSWDEVRWDFTSNDWKIVPDGKKGTTTNGYGFLYPNPDTELPNEKVVELTRIEKPDTGFNAWVIFGASLPVGQKQYMVYQMVTDLEGGWDGIRATPDWT